MSTSEPEMRQVTKDEFYTVMNPLDAHPRIMTDKYPYWELWHLRDGRTIVGKSVGHVERGRVWTAYYLPGRAKP